MDVPLMDPESQMSLLERLAIEALLAHIRPKVAIELGTYRGGSLRRIAAWSEHVHTFDLTLKVDPSEFPAVSFHVGDSHALLPTVLAELEQRGESVDFVLIDGDHSPDGVRRDVLDVLASSASNSSAIVMHDMGNEAVRRGVESIPFADFSKVAWADLDFVPTQRSPHGATEGWGGLGMLLTDGLREGPGAVPPRAAPASDPWRHVREAHRRTRRLGAVALHSLREHRASSGSRHGR
jgi:hypothetical protein